MFRMARRAIACLCVLIAACLLAAPSARAAQYEFGVKTGVSSFTVEASDAYKKDGGMGIDIRPQMNLQWPNINFSAGIFYQGHIGSEIGSFPMNMLGMQLAYWPTGLSISKSVLDNGVRVQHNRLAPFLAAGVDMTGISITDTKSQSTPISFNAFSVGFQLGGGVDFPMGENTSLVMELEYEGTAMKGGANSSSVTGGSGSLPIDYKSVAGFLGIMIHP